MGLLQTDFCGWGLKADEDIKAGDFLVEYVGEGKERELSCMLTVFAEPVIFIPPYFLVKFC